MTDKKIDSEEMRREEIRGLFTLGLMAVLVAARLSFNSEGVIKWGMFQNVPVTGMIDTILIAWGLYAFFMVFGFSTHAFSLETCKKLRDLGRACLFLSLALLILFIVIIAIENLTVSFYLTIIIAIVFALSRIYDKIRQKFRFSRLKNIF